MNYGNCIYNKLKNQLLICRFLFFENVGMFGMPFGIDGVFCIINCYFGCDSRIRSIFCIHEDVLKVFSNIFLFKRVTEM